LRAVRAIYHLAVARKADSIKVHFPGYGQSCLPAARFTCTMQISSMSSRAKRFFGKRLPPNEAPTGFVFILPLGSSNTLERIR